MYTGCGARPYGGKALGYERTYCSDLESRCLVTCWQSLVACIPLVNNVSMEIVTVHDEKP